jgi:Tfp pilus assembly protein PilF
MLERATKIDPRFLTAHVTLAALLERSGRYDAAIARYRTVVNISPDNVMALNNLAYLLAVQRKSPKEGLPFAQRAYARSKSAAIADTLGWIHHLLGNNKAAEPLLLTAAKAASSNAEVVLHAAIVLEANGKRAEAAQMLTRAERADSAITRRDDARQLRERLARPSGK